MLPSGTGEEPESQSPNEACGRCEAVLVHQTDATCACGRISEEAHEENPSTRPVQRRGRAERTK
jgi:hypothetical protein